jgi:hypothetical protein
MPDLELDHVLFFVDPDVPQVGALNAAGLCESFRRRHSGQGTANACYCFDNAYLELIWETDPTEIRAPPVARLRLAERAAWQRTGACPFGIAVRKYSSGSQLPFEVWEYFPPYRPAGTIISVAAASDDLRQPLLFCSPGGLRPDTWTDGPAAQRQRAAGLTEIEDVQLSLPRDLRPTAALMSLVSRELISVGRADGNQPSLVLKIARLDGGPPRSLRLPTLDWM